MGFRDGRQRNGHVLQSTVTAETYQRWRGYCKCLATILCRLLCCLFDTVLQVNIASVAGATGFPGCASYSASKHAVLGLTRTAARENPDIRVNAVLPGKCYERECGRAVTEHF